MANDLTPLEMDVLHIVKEWGPMDIDRIEEMRLAAAVAKIATETFELVKDGYLDMRLIDKVVHVVGLEGPVPLDEIIHQMVNDKDLSVFFDPEGEEDA